MKRGIKWLIKIQIRRNCHQTQTSLCFAEPGDSNVIWEAFVTGTEPNREDMFYNAQEIIGHEANIVNPYGDNPYGDNMYGEQPDIYENGAVEIYEIPASETQNNNPFSFFSNRRKNQNENERVLIPSEQNNPEPRTAPTQKDTPTNNNLNGTGGLY